MILFSLQKVILQTLTTFKKKGFGFQKHEQDTVGLFPIHMLFSKEKGTGKSGAAKVTHNILSFFVNYLSLFESKINSKVNKQGTLKLAFCSKPLF